MDDQALLAAARAGDQRAFAALYRNHHRRAMHEARKVVRNDSDAEDCVAAAYASTFQAMRKGGGPTEAFRPYLLTATRNAALQLVRLKRYGSEVATDVLEPPAHVDLYEIGADPAIRNAFATLPERWRETLDVYVISYLAEATTPVGRGENAHRSLQEFNIVRSFRRLGRWNGTPQQMKVPLASLPADATAIAVVLQRADQGAIAGAATLQLR